MDILRELNDEELNYIIQRLEANLPYAIKDLYFILTAKRCNELKDNYENISDRVLSVFYTHRNGVKENYTIFGITGKRDHKVWFFTFEESLQEVTECLQQTKLIRWNENLLFVTIHKEHTQPVLDHAARWNFNLKTDEDAAYYWLPKEEALKFKVDISQAPDGTYVRALKEEDSQLCNSRWEWGDSASEAFVRSLILLNGGFGLFAKSNNELLSFALINDHLATGILQTAEQERGKKYGEFISKLLAVKIVELFDLIPTCYINSLNFKSIKLFEKLGYKKIGNCNWIFITKAGE